MKKGFVTKIYGSKITTSVRRSKNEPTTTLPMKKYFFFEMSAAFEFCVLSSNFGFIG